MRPLIAVSTSEIREPTHDVPAPEADPPRRDMVLGLRYVQAIEAAGGCPVVVPPLDASALEAVLDRVDGLCLSGGPDLDPAAYGEDGHPALGPTEPALDAVELALARAADERALPILAICRGLQALNVARGGTLHQHLPDIVGDDVAHRQAAPSDEPTHPVRIDPGSRLSGVLGSTRVDVNSFHHQAASALGTGLAPVGWALDGTLEAVESVESRFVIGVQWHAECLAGRAEQLALFAALVDAARSSPVPCVASPAS